MKRIGKGDYAWSTRRADLEERTAAIGMQAAAYAAEGDTMMAAGTASLAGRCALDFIDAETRERVPRANDVQPTTRRPHRTGGARPLRAKTSQPLPPEARREQDRHDADPHRTSLEVHETNDARVRRMRGREPA